MRELSLVGLGDERGRGLGGVRRKGKGSDEYEAMEHAAWSMKRDKHRLFRRLFCSCKSDVNGAIKRFIFSMVFIKSKVHY